MNADEAPASPDDPLPAGADDRLARASATVGRIRAELERVIVGQEDVIELVLVALLAGGHVLLEGVPGVGKTLLALALSRTFAGEFSRIQFTPDLMPSDVTGHAMYDLESGTFRIRRGPAFAHILLADEINRAPAKTQAALLEVMQEGQITIEGESHRLAQPFMTLATQNPIEQEGTYPLPEAQLDRFLFKVLVDYPLAQDERELVKRVTFGRSDNGLSVEAVSTVVTPADVIDAQVVTSGIDVVDAIVEYAVEIARTTRQSAGIAVGAGPRGAISLVRAARAVALLDGRGFVVPDDIKSVARAALRHRVTLAPEAALDGMGADAAIEDVLARVEAPRT